MKNDFLDWYNKTEKEVGTLISPSVASNLLNIKTQRLTGIINQGRLKRYQYKNKTFLSRNEVNIEIERRKKLKNSNDIIKEGKTGTIKKIININK